MIGPLVILFLFFEVWRRGKRIKKLETREGPKLDLKTFEAVILQGYVHFGEEYLDIVANTCTYTAQRLGIAVTAKEEVRKQIDEESLSLLTELRPDATDRLTKLFQMRDLLI